MGGNNASYRTKKGENAMKLEMEGKEPLVIFFGVQRSRKARFRFKTTCRLSKSAKLSVKLSAKS